MPGIDDLFSPPNGPAYERQEVRTGPPLEYVAEKLRGAVEASYSMCRIVLGVRPGLEVDARKVDLNERELSHHDYRTARVALRYSVHAYLALQNMMGVMNDEGLLDRLICGTRDDLDAWLDRVQQEGSVLG